MLTFNNRTRNNFKTVTDAACKSYNIKASLRVVVLRGGVDGKYFNSKQKIVHQPLSISTEDLNALFTDMKHMLSLEELSLELPINCSCIAWPDLSRLRVLHLGISGERNWKLSSLLPRLTLNSLKITSTSILYLEDCIAIGELLSPSRCPKNVIIEIDQKFCITKIQPAVKEKPPSDQNSSSALVEIEIFDDQNKDYMGYCITHSYYQWMLTVTNKTAESSSRLYNNAGVMDLCQDKAKNVTKHKFPRFSVLTKSLHRHEAHAESGGTITAAASRLFLYCMARPLSIASAAFRNKKGKKLETKLYLTTF